MSLSVLSDPENRAAYDQLGQGRDFQAGSDFQPPPGWDAGFEFTDEDLAVHRLADFSDFFLLNYSEDKRALVPGQARQRMRGEDHHAKIMLDLEDTYHGASRSLTLRVPKLDNQGRTLLTEHTLNVRIPKGVHAAR